MSVNLYDPNTLQGSVWNEKDAPKKISEGFLTEEQFLAQMKVKQEESYQQWLNSSDTIEERFQLLRQARDARISETDYLMTTDYPIDEEKKKLVEEYRQALRDLPEQEGAPWDGGGKLTPWPEKNF